MRGPSLSQSSESDVEEQPNAFTITSNPQYKIQVDKQKYDQSSESDISSLSEDDEDQRYPRLRVEDNKQTIDMNASEQSEESSQESSGIDVIEQRIKKLEVDLSAKIEKQRQVSSKPEKQVKKFNGNHLFSNPPLPPPRYENKNNIESKVKEPEQKFYPFPSENLNKMNIQEKQQFLGMGQTTKAPKVEEKHPEIIKDDSPKKKVKKVIEEKGSPKNNKNRINSRKEKTKEPSAVALLHKAHKQIDDMQKVIDELKKQNENLKEQLKKKKPQRQELSKLRKLSSGGGDLKLQKQIQTLKAIESLEAKLKKSIAKKMKGGQSNISGVNS